MSNKETIKQDSLQFCDNGKIIYNTEYAASLQIKGLLKREKGKYGVYKCPLGDHFHIRTVTKIKKRLRKFNKYPISFNRSGNIESDKKKKSEPKRRK